MCAHSERRAHRRERMLHLLESGLVTAETLARDLDVTQRTVYREISFLRDEGHRILGAAGAGYMLRERPTRHG